MLGVILLGASLLLGALWLLLHSRLLPYSFHDNGEYNQKVIFADSIIVVIMVGLGIGGAIAIV